MAFTAVTATIDSKSERSKQAFGCYNLYSAWKYYTAVLLRKYMWWLNQRQFKLLGFVFKHLRNSQKPVRKTNRNPPSNLMYVNQTQRVRRAVCFVSSHYITNEPPSGGRWEERQPGGRKKTSGEKKPTEEEQQRGRRETETSSGMFCPFSPPLLILYPTPLSVIGVKLWSN